MSKKRELVISIIKKEPKDIMYCIALNDKVLALHELEAHNLAEVEGMLDSVSKSIYHLHHYKVYGKCPCSGRIVDGKVLCKKGKK